MKNKIIASLVALSALALSACSNTQPANKCTAWVADNGPYLVHYQAVAGQDSTCLANQLNLYGIPFDGAYDNISAQLYIKGDTQELDLLPVDLVLGSPDGYDPQNLTRNPAITIAAGNFSSGLVGDDDRCTVPTTSAASDTAFNPAGTSFKFSDLNFLEDSTAQGAAFQGKVEITAGGCTANYVVTAMGPEVQCGSNDDCLPVPNPAKGRYFSSGIAGSFHTFCDLGTSATDWTGDPSTGVCFFAEEFPSLCPDGEFEGEAGSACPVGQ